MDFHTAVVLILSNWKEVFSPMVEKEHLIDLVGISKEFDGVQVLKNINLYIRKKEFITLLGPSGCGKTTTLRIIGGFETPSEGQVLFGGQDISALPPYKRRVNTVFQKYALFPHLNVYDNIAFGLKLKKLPKKQIAEKVGQMLELVNLKGYEKRHVDALSGGQQQRVAIARALAPHPRLLLLDEPLSALDAWSRASIGEQLRAIQEASGVTTVMVTHDRQEALSLSDYVVVMNAGHVEQADEPNDIYDRPASEFVATFVGGMNIVRMPLIREGAATGLRYADVKLYRATEAALTRPYTFVGQVQAVQFMGDAVRVKVLLNDFQTTITADALRINTDRSVFSLHSLIAVELPESAWRTWGAQ